MIGPFPGLNTKKTTGFYYFFRLQSYHRRGQLFISYGGRRYAGIQRPVEQSALAAAAVEAEAKLVQIRLQMLRPKPVIRPYMAQNHFIRAVWLRALSSRWSATPVSRTCTRRRSAWLSCKNPCRRTCRSSGPKANVSCTDAYGSPSPLRTSAGTQVYSSLPAVPFYCPRRV